MSRIGKKIIELPTGVTINKDRQLLEVKGPQGTLKLKVVKNIEVIVTEKEIQVKPKNLKQPTAKALWGTYRMLIANMVEGVTKGFEKKLELVGTGYKVAVNGKKMVLELGFSHPVEVEAPAGITFEAEKNMITVKGIDKQMVGEMAAEIRAKKKVEPYKGKGIHYVGEYIRRKEGKRVAGEGE